MLLIPGKHYERMEIHEKMGGNTQAGISWSAKYPVIFLFASERAKKYGYANVISPTGTNLFTGVGQIGDMKFTRINAEVFNHERNHKELHLFLQLGGGIVEYVGQMRYIGHRIFDGVDKEGNTRKIIQFALSPNLEVV